MSTPFRVQLGLAEYCIAMFEPFGGGAGQIDALFQIEDEINESALDSGDLALTFDNTVPHQAGGPTNNAARRRSVSSHHASAPPSQRMDPKTTESALTVTTDISRKRRSAFFGLDLPTSPVHPSPLAQLYQPVVLIGDNESEQMELAPQGSSYGPRRRLASMTRQRRPSLEPFQPSSVPSQPIHLHAHSHPARPGGPPPAEHMDMPTPPTTVLERAEEMASPGEDSQISKRLMEIEQRQQRIENLLVALAGELRTTGTRPAKVGS